MALLHKICNGSLYHIWVKRLWVNSNGREFNLGAWFCQKCKQEILSQGEMYFSYLEDEKEE